MLFFNSFSAFLEYSMASEWLAWVTRKKDAHCFPFLFQCLMEKMNGSSSKVNLTFKIPLAYSKFIETFSNKRKSQ